MSSDEEARQKSHSDISDDIRLIHWTGEVDPSWEPAKSVIKDKVPRMNETGYLVIPLTFFKRGRYHADLSLPSDGIDIPLPRPEKILVIDDRMGNGSADPRSPQWLKVDAYEEWEHFFLCYSWAFRRPGDESLLLPFERDYFDRKKTIRVPPRGRMT